VGSASAGRLFHRWVYTEFQYNAEKRKSVELFKQKFNCSQAVFTAYRQADILEEKDALKLATVFGAGAAGSGNELCGAVSGALLAISMRYGRGDIHSTEAKTKTYDLGKQFMADFSSCMGSCACGSILEMNIGNPENLQKAREMKLFETRCVDAVKAASDILEKML
jgi:C_GCAxxG_C_C family probable redox protein